MILECKQAFSIEIFEECYDHDNVNNIGDSFNSRCAT